MRHNKKGKKLNLKKAHKKSIFKNITNQLIKYELIKTTLSKAKEIRRFIEPLINISKIDNIKNRRNIFKKVRNNNTVSKLFNNIGPNIIKTKGGYTRIIKCGYRKGDNAKMAYIELINKIRF